MIFSTDTASTPFKTSICMLRHIRYELWHRWHCEARYTKSLRRKLISAPVTVMCHKRKPVDGSADCCEDLMLEDGSAVL